MAWLGIIFAAVPAVIYLAAGLPVTAGTISIGTLIAFTTLQNNLFRPITGLLGTSVSVISSLALFARIFEYLDLPVELTSPPARRASTWPRSKATSVSTMSASPTPAPIVPP
jgi:ATP-binding cassette, subfamily B, bacterial